MQDFEETKGLSGEQLHEALEHGDERDRVLAIWALALRSTSALSLTEHLRGEPDAGVRRALAVVLAGHGEIDLLVAMSRHDPSVHVRASTTQIVVRFAAADRVPWSLVMERLSDAPEVRASVLSQIAAASPISLREAAVACLADESDLVRRESFETCARLAHAGVLDAKILRDVVDHANHGERAHLLGTWFAIEAADEMCVLLASAPFDVRVHALTMFPALATSALAPLLEDAELYDHVARQLGLVLAHASLRLVLELAVRNRWGEDYARECIARLHKLERLPDELRSIASTLRERCIQPEPESVGEGEMVWVEDDYWDDDDHEPQYGTQPDDYEMLRVELDRLL